MSYKTVLVHVDQSQHCAARVKVAAEIAVAQEAHLDGAAMTGVSRYIYPEGALYLSAMLDTQRQHANEELDQFEAIAKANGVLSYETRLGEDDAAGGLALQARYSDLVILSQADPSESNNAELADLPEYVMLNAPRPVLTIPYAGKFSNIGSNVLVAWDGTMEATRAVNAALPFLKRAKNVNVVIFNASKRYGAHGEQPGADIALYLARHGVKVTVLQEVTDLDIGNALLSLAADKGSDLLVMGGYGHTRFREVLLGGVTLTILKTMTLPVLMAH